MAWSILLDIPPLPESTGCHIILKECQGLQFLRKQWPSTGTLRACLQVRSPLRGGKAGPCSLLVDVLCPCLILDCHSIPHKLPTPAIADGI